jgi:transglutaminase-like putative cysteine protease
MRLLHAVLAAALVAPSALAQGAKAKPPPNLLKNGDFEAGLSSWSENWPRQHLKVAPKYDRVKEGAHGGKACAQVTVTEAGFCTLAQEVPKRKDVTLIRLEGWVDWTPDPAAPGMPVVMITFTDDAEHYDNRFANWERSAKGWTKVSVDAAAPPDSSRWLVRVGVEGRGTARFDDLVLTAGTGKPGEASETVTLARVHGDYRLVEKGDGSADPRLEFPISFPFEGQTPLALKVTTQPVGRVRSLEIVPDDENRHLKVHLAGLGIDVPIEVRYEALVLVRDRKRGKGEGVALAERSKLPPEVARFFDETPGIDPGYPPIQAVAKTIRTDTMQHAVDDVLAWMRANLKPISGGDQGGKATFERKGAACTGNANLAASIFQAAGVPARVLGCVGGERLQEHYIVEVWAPGEGWRRVEAAGKAFPIPDSSQIILHVAHPKFVRNAINAAIFYQGADGCRATIRYGPDGAWQGMTKAGTYTLTQDDTVRLERSARDAFKAWETKRAEKPSVSLVGADASKPLSPKAGAILAAIEEFQK